MLWLNQESDCLRRRAQTLLAKVRRWKRRSFINTVSAIETFSWITNCCVICAADPSLQSSYPAFVMYTSLIYKNMTTPVYTTLKGVSAASHYIVNFCASTLCRPPPRFGSCRKPLCWAAARSQTSRPAPRSHLVQERRTAPSAALTPPPAPAKTAAQAARALSREVQAHTGIPEGFWCRPQSTTLFPLLLQLCPCLQWHQRVTMPSLLTPTPLTQSALNQSRNYPRPALQPVTTARVWANVYLHPCMYS